MDALVEVSGITTISCKEDAEKAVGLLKALKSLRKEIEESYKPSLDKIRLAEKTLRDEMKSRLAPVDEAEAKIKQLMLAYDKAEQERIRKEREIALEEAKKRAEEEKARQVEALKMAGLEDIADQVKEVDPVVSIELPKQEKVAGISYRKNYRAEVVDLKELVKAVADGNAPLSTVMANEKVLNQFAKAMKEEFVIPGCKLIVEKIAVNG